MKLMIFLVCLFFLLEENIAYSTELTDTVDVVYLKDGSFITGKILENTSKRIVIQIPNEKELVNLDASVVNSVAFSIQLGDVDKHSSKKEVVKNEEKNFTKIGLLYGTPGTFNFGVNFYSENTYFSLCGGVLVEKVRGVQLGVFRKLNPEKKIYHSIGGVMGFIDFPSKPFQSDENWRYLGVVYKLNLHTIVIAPGISFGYGSYSNPQFLIQAGLEFSI